jgi:hypothetical protein
MLLHIPLVCYDLDCISILSEVVDELVLEVASEVDGQEGRGDAFAFDLLVAAVAFSQGEYEVGSQVCGRRMMLLKLNPLGY